MSWHGIEVELRSVIVAVITGTYVLCGACSPDAPPGSSVRTVIDTVSGVERVVSTGTAPMWTSVRVTRIGTATGDGPDAFGRIRAIELDDDLNVYVADMQTSHIQVFDSTGRHVRTIGRRGAGPGEFETPYSLGWLGDTLVVLDFRNARIGLFSRDGQWIDAWRWQPLSGNNVRLLNGSRLDLYAPVMRDFRRGRGLAFIYLDGTASPDTIVVPPRPDVPAGPICRYPNNGGIEFFGIPFGPDLHIAGAPNRTLFVGWSASYRIAQVTQTGDTVRVIERPRLAVPITDVEWDERTARYRSVRQDNPGTRCEPREQPRPASKPAFRWIGQDVDQRLWVEVYTPQGFGFEVFDAVGRLIGELVEPARDAAVHPAVRGDRFAVVTRDSLDVQYVEVYRVAVGDRN